MPEAIHDDEYEVIPRAPHALQLVHRLVTGWLHVAKWDAATIAELVGFERKRLLEHEPIPIDVVNTATDEQGGMVIDAATVPGKLDGTDPSDHGQKGVELVALFSNLMIGLAGLCSSGLRHGPVIFRNIGLRGQLRVVVQVREKD